MTTPTDKSNEVVFAYNGIHEAYFNELLSKVNQRYKGTKAELPSVGKDGSPLSGEVHVALLQRMAITSTIVSDPSLFSNNLFPITPEQSELLLQKGHLTGSNESWETLALLLYDKHPKGQNHREARALQKEIGKYRVDLGLSSSDLERRLVIVNAGLELESSFTTGVRPIILPGFTLVYPHDTLDMLGNDYKFEFGLEKGMPSVCKLGKGNRTLLMPPNRDRLGLRTLSRLPSNCLCAWDFHLNGVKGRMNFIYK